MAVAAVRGNERVTLAQSALVAPLPKAARPTVMELVVDDQVLDRGLVLVCHDRIEVHLHAAPAVLDRLGEFWGGWRPAAVPPPSERLLRTAATESQLALGLEQLTYDWRRFVLELGRLGRAERLAGLRLARARSRVALAQVQAEPLVLCGAPNAGKSTLMNRLVFGDRSLTGDLVGLTRDPVRERTTLADYPYDVTDTAGERADATGLDSAAMALGRAARERGWRLVVVDGRVGPSAHDASLWNPRTLFVRNKADLPLTLWPDALAPCLTVSCRTDSAAEIRHRVGERLRQLRGLPLAGPVGGPAAMHAEDFALLSPRAQRNRSS